MSEAKPKRKFWQFHLLTLVLMVLAVGASIGVGVSLHNRFALLKCDDVNSAIGNLHVDCVKDPQSLLEAVRLICIRGDQISVADVKDDSRFTPTFGPDGVLGNISENLANGLFPPYDTRTINDEVHLYPYTDLHRVILLQLTDRNWIPFSPENYSLVQSRVQLLSKIHAEVLARSLGYLLYEHSYIGFAVTAIGILCVCLLCEWLIRRREARRT